VQTIRRWWQDVGRVRYPLARRLLITADGGGSNGSRARLWKRELQKLADELGITIEVHHLPPGTSKPTPRRGEENKGPDLDQQRALWANFCPAGRSAAGEIVIG
jgi:hypothetical protein